MATDKESEGKLVMIAVDGSDQADEALDCKDADNVVVDVNAWLVMLVGDGRRFKAAVTDTARVSHGDRWRCNG